MGSSAIPSPQVEPMHLSWHSANTQSMNWELCLNRVYTVFPRYEKHIQGDKIEDLSVWSYGFWLALTVHVASMFLDPSRFSRSALLLSSLTTQSKQVGAEEPKETTHNVPHNSTPKGEIMEILTLWALHGYSEKNDKTSAVKLRRQENLVHSQVGKFWQGPSLNIRQGPWAFHAWPKFKSGFGSSVGNKFDCSDWFMGWQHIWEQKNKY